VLQLCAHTWRYLEARERERERQREREIDTHRGREQVSGVQTRRRSGWCSSCGPILEVP